MWTDYFRAGALLSNSSLENPVSEHGGVKKKWASIHFNKVTLENLTEDFFFFPTLGELFMNINQDLTTKHLRENV